MKEETFAVTVGEGDEDGVVDYLTILDVDDNQFFIDENGCLCQKIEDYTFNIIADANGFPYTEYNQYMYDDERIKRIINHGIRFVIDDAGNLTITNDGDK